MDFDALFPWMRALIPWMAWLTMLIVLVGSAILLTWDIAKKVRNTLDKRRSTFDPDVVIEEEE